MAVGLYLDEALGGYGYPEKPWFLPHERLGAYLAEARRRGLDRHPRARILRAPLAADAELERFHSPGHVARVRALCNTNEGALDHGPTLARASVERAASHVVGAVCDAVRRLVSGELTRAFVPIAGFHHAHRDEARMYCLYNDCAIAIASLLTATRAPVAYLDVDVHFGDGVYRAFADDPRVIAADVHEDGRTLFPHSPSAPSKDPAPGGAEDVGDGAARGSKLNLPLDAGSGDAEFAMATDRAIAFLEARAPEIVVVQAGLDALAGDPMAHLQVSIEGYRRTITAARALAERACGGRMLVLGGGGYRTEAVAAAWCATTEIVLKD